jgi:predicted flap endonuclease-1-like 5' DNA nuclease
LVLGGWSFLQGAFVGFVVFVALGAIISWVMTRPLPAPGEVKLQPTAAPTVKASAAPVASAAPKPAPKPAQAPAPKPEAKAPKAAETPVAPAAKGDRPALMKEAPDGGQADDLQKITGVGPKLEQTLNELGIWHYAQVAALTKDDIAWVDERLRFKGRIERDDWVGQAKDLVKAKG